MILSKYEDALHYHFSSFLGERQEVEYFDLWRILKALNIKTFSLDGGQVEFILHKVIVLL